MDAPGLLRSLAPWVAVARARASLSLDTFAEPRELERDLWIHWRLSNEPLGVMDTEAMELLDLAARVNYDAAWTLLLEITTLGVYTKSLLETLRAARIYPRFVIETLSRAFLRRVFKVSAGQFVFALDGVAHSPTYAAVKSLLLQCLAAKSEVSSPSGFTRDDANRIPVRFAADCWVFSRPEPAADMLREVAQLSMLSTGPELYFMLQDSWIDKLQSLSRPPLAPNKVFRLCSTSVNFGPVVITDTLLRCAQATSSRWGVQVDSLMLGSMELEPEQLTPLATSSFFQTMLLRQPRERMPTSLGLFSHVRIELFQAACSALLTNQSLRFVVFSLPEIDFDDADHRLFWPWVAYSLFSAEATNAVDHAKLEIFDLTQDHVDSFRDVLLARDPLAAVPIADGRPYQAPSAERLARDPVVVDLRPKSLLVVPMRFQTDQEIRTQDQLETVRVVEDPPDSHHVAVVYPGVGSCWVHRRDVVARRVLHGSDAGHEGTRASVLRRLELEVNHATSLDAVLSLLRRIASGVHTLAISAFGGVTYSDAFLRGLFDACPQLRRLDLMKGRVSNFAWLVETAGAASHVRQLQALSLAAVESVDAQAYERLLTALGDERLMLSRTLCQLHLQHEARVLESWTDHALALLAKNLHLQRLLVSVDREESAETLQASTVERLARHDCEPLQLRKAPLSLRCKLAFLSVLPGSNDSDDAYVDTAIKRWRLPDLHGTCVAVVFAFAAPTWHRECGVVPFRPYR